MIKTVADKPCKWELSRNQYPYEAQTIQRRNLQMTSFLVLNFEHSDFYIVSDFGFRISSL